MTIQRTAAVAALMLVLAPIGAMAEPGNGNGRGLAVRGEDGIVVCPPGLARRDPACIPPGQARRMISEEEREQRRAARRAERRSEAAREAEEEAHAEPEDVSDDRNRAAAILAALLPPRDQAASTSNGVRADAVPATEPTPAAAAGVEVSEAIRQAAAAGEVGY